MTGKDDRDVSAPGSFQGRSLGGGGCFLIGIGLSLGGMMGLWEGIADDFERIFAVADFAGGCVF